MSCCRATSRSARPSRLRTSWVISPASRKFSTSRANGGPTAAWRRATCSPPCWKADQQVPARAPPRVRSRREIDGGQVVVGVPAGRSVPPAREQRAGEGERGSAGLRGLGRELGVLEGVLERERGAEVPGQHAAGLLHGVRRPERGRL